MSVTPQNLPSALERLRQTPDELEALVTKLSGARLARLAELVFRIGQTEFAVGQRLRRIEPPVADSLTQVLESAGEWPDLVALTYLRRFRELRTWNLVLLESLSADTPEHPGLQLLHHHDEKCLKEIAKLIP